MHYGKSTWHIKSHQFLSNENVSILYKGMFEKIYINPPLHQHFFVYPNTLPPDWLNWCNNF